MAPSLYTYNHYMYRGLNRRHTIGDLRSIFCEVSARHCCFEENDRVRYDSRSTRSEKFKIWEDNTSNTSLHDAHPSSRLSNDSITLSENVSSLSHLGCQQRNSSRVSKNQSSPNCSSVSSVTGGKEVTGKSHHSIRKTSVAEKGKKSGHVRRFSIIERSRENFDARCNLFTAIGAQFDREAPRNMGDQQESGSHILFSTLPQTDALKRLP